MSKPQIPVSPAALKSEEEKKDSSPPIPELLPKQKDILEIAKITTCNDWVILVPFTIETNLLLPATTDYRNIGMVVGKSNSIMTPNGQRIQSALEYGQVVLFQKRAVVGEMAIAKEPYLGRKLIILSERNIICRLPAVPFKILDEEIGAESFPQLQPEDK